MNRNSEGGNGLDKLARPPRHRSQSHNEGWTDVKTELCFSANIPSLNQVGPANPQSKRSAKGLSGLRYGPADADPK